MSIKDSINQAKAEAKEVVGKVTGDKKTELKALRKSSLTRLRTLLRTSRTL